jgi:hypothetical protein
MSERRLTLCYEVKCPFPRSQHPFDLGDPNATTLGLVLLPPSPWTKPAAADMLSTLAPLSAHPVPQCFERQPTLCPFSPGGKPERMLSRAQQTSAQCCLNPRAVWRLAWPVQCSCHGLTRVSCGAEVVVDLPPIPDPCLKTTPSCWGCRKKKAGRKPR